MNGSELERRFISSASLVPPLDFLENPYSGAAEAAAVLFARCSAICGDDKGSFHSWLSRCLDDPDPGLAFFGSVMHQADPSDIDLLSFTGGGNRFHRPTKFHITDAFSGSTPDPIAAFFSGPLLFPVRPSKTALAAIEKGRERFLKSPFLDGGIGDLLAHSAYKSSLSREGPLPAGIRVIWQWLDDANMQTMTYSPRQICRQILAQMQKLDDRSLSAMTESAIRRMRVRHEQRAALAERFVWELRAKQIRGSFG
ncbi:MAG: hypothetical protein U0R44_02905 [Candidatus Micrarchaeia archaeon]